MGGNGLLDRVNERYGSLSKGQKLLAAYITDNYGKAAFLTAEAALPYGCPFCLSVRVQRISRFPEGDGRVGAGEIAPCPSNGGYLWGYQPARNF